MTKQKQIEEMTEKMQRCFEKNGLLNFKWFAEALFREYPKQVGKQKYQYLAFQDVVT